MSRTVTFMMLLGLTLAAGGQHTAAAREPR